MSLKKTLLLASAAMALTAFALPAATQANQWYTDVTTEVPGEKKLGETPESMTFEGELSTTSESGFRSGPCDVQATIDLWNLPAGGTGTVTKFTVSDPCETSVPGCEVKEAGVTGLPWHLDVEGDEVAIAGVGLFDVYNDGCTGAGIPPFIPIGIGGTLTASFDGEDCFEFDDSGDLENETGKDIEVDGSLCREGSKPLTLNTGGGSESASWYRDEMVPGSPEESLVGSTTATGDHISLTGSLSTTAGPGFAFRSGPCQITATVDLWNHNGQATGEVTNFVIGGEPCPTSVPGCEASEIENGGGFPWHIDVSGDLISITTASFSNRYNDGCTAIGLPPGVPLGGSGTATATFNTTTHCFDFSESGDLSGALGPIRTDGTLCPETGKTLTLK